MRHRLLRDLFMIRERRCAVVDNAFNQGLIPADLVSISFEPATDVTSLNGELTFGGTDTSKFIAPITFT